MRSTRKHYESHLGPIYAWMSGSARESREQNRHLFDELGINGPGLAVDLGCGNGAQSIPLANLGYQVTAVDFCEVLLDELAAESDSLPIEIVHEDIDTFDAPEAESLNLATCMGDTLPHLASLEAVELLIQRVSSWLKPGGLFVLSYRDYISTVLSGEKRFIPVRQDSDQLLTCFLEYRRETVTVYDIINRRSGDSWVQDVSSYKKSRIDPRWLDDKAHDYGLSILSQIERQGMLIACFHKRRAA